LNRFSHFQGWELYLVLNLPFDTKMSPMRWFLSLCLLIPLLCLGQSPLNQGSSSTVWILSDLIHSDATGINLAGKPELINSKYGKALLFNGLTDGIFLDQMPLAGLAAFTVEVIICPYSGGTFEQRYFHCGEIRGNRVMLELRSTPTDWYLDAFIQSGEQKKTLIEPAYLHPLDQWAHLAFVVDHQTQATYVNGKKELESSLQIQPLREGKTSLGVRQNKISWFRGAIYKIRISPKALSPGQFMVN
jgi:Concanavalin A-like lectin/glucanases superfamily